MLADPALKNQIFREYVEARFEIVVTLLEKLTDPPWATCYWPNFIKLEMPDRDAIAERMAHSLEQWFNHPQMDVPDFDHLVEHYARLRLLVMANLIVADSRRIVPASATAHGELCAAQGG